MQISNSNGINNLYNIKKKSDLTMLRLSTALRINSAKDDPAGLAISTRMTSEINGLNAGTRNVQDAYSFAQTADGATNSASQVLQRMRELSLQADNDTLSANDKQSIQGELNNLKSEYDHIVSTTNFNGQGLLNTNNGISVNSGNGTSSVSTTDLTSSVGGTVDLENMDVTATGGAQSALSQIDGAIDQLSQARSSFGANMSALSAREDLNNDMEIASASSRSRIQDADMASEISENVKTNILAQSNIAMLHQSQVAQYSMLQLLK